jgi:hypothetical protein
MLARQALYCLSHASSPFCSGYFADSVWLFAEASLDHNPPILHFLLILIWQALEQQACATTPSFFPLRWGLANFLPRLFWNAILLISASYLVWDDRHEALHPAIDWDETHTVCPSWSSTSVLLISASKVARITGMSHWQLTCSFLFIFPVFLYVYVRTYEHKSSPHLPF